MFNEQDDFKFAPQPKISDQEIKYFGYDFFDNVPFTFSALEDIPVPQDYILGPGDELKVILYGNKNSKYSLVITRDGEIFLPEIGPIYVAGLPFAEMNKLITVVVEQQLIGTQVSVSMGALRSINIFVLGQAEKPGMYTIGSLSSLTNAIFSSGGLKPNGSLRNIQLKRSGKTIANYDLYDLLLNGDTSNEKRLQAGDVIFIPKAEKKVAILGEVERPGIYELTTNENFTHLINFAGGYKFTADKSAIDIFTVNQESNGFELQSIDTSIDFSRNLKNGDTINIGSINKKLDGAITISGHYPLTGYYPIKNGYRVNNVIKSYDELLPFTDTRYLLIKRQLEGSKKFKALQINIDKLRNGNNEENKVLQERDELIFFPSQLSMDLIEEIEEIEVRNTDQDIEKTKDLEDQKESDLTKSDIENRDESDSTFSNLDQDIDQIGYEDEPVYRVYDYCQLTEKEMDQIRGRERVSKDPVDQSLLTNEVTDESESDVYKLTELCRRALLDKVNDSLTMQNSQGLSPFIRVTGDIFFPGDYPYTSESSILDMVNAAGGFLNSEAVESIELNRFSIKNNEVVGDREEFGIADIDNKEVLPGDHIAIKQLDNRIEYATVIGEVQIPGEYIVNVGDTLKSLVSRAGGFTNQASSNNLILTRESIARTELKRLNESREELNKRVLLATTGLGTSEDSDQYIQRLLSLINNIDSENTAGLGRLVFDFDEVFNDKNLEIFLEDGDTISVPKNSQSVSVIGEINSPNTHLFDASITIEDYIQLSGGKTNFADEDGVYVIKANGNVVKEEGSAFFRQNRFILEPGDTIVVPIEIKIADNIKVATDLTQIIYQMAVAAAAVQSF